MNDDSRIIQDFILQGRRNRPGFPMIPKFITIHDTANTRAGADARAHANYLKSNAAALRGVSWHYTVDDKEIYQHLPLNENGWHAGDGRNGIGNRQSIGIEICENRDGNRGQAEANAAWLTAKMLTEWGLSIYAVRQHYNWSRKNCPRIIRARKDGWNKFLSLIISISRETPGKRNLYRVQVGAFSERKNAETMVKRLAELGFSGVIVEEKKH